MIFFQTLLDLIFPRSCLDCHSRLDSSKILCEKCHAELEFNQEIIQSDEHIFDCAYAVYDFNEIIQPLIHELKYNEMRNIAKFLGKQASKFILENPTFPKIDYIIPVPLHKVKKRSRGFNQAELLTKEISRNCNFTHLPKVMLRNRFTTTQTQLGRIERHKNVSAAFDLRKAKIIQGKNILLVDDVFTTGATVNSISNVLKSNGVSRIIVLTIARA